MLGVMSETVTRLPAPSATRLLTAREMAAKLGTARPRVYALMREHGLPAPVKITAKSSRWIESEIDAWIASRPRAGRSTRHDNAPAVAAGAFDAHPGR